MSKSGSCGTWFLLALSLSAGPAVAQRSTSPAVKGSAPSPPEQHPKLAVSANADPNAISIFAVVSDKRAGPVQNLKRDDFQLQADKKPETIVGFGSAKELPLTVGLIVSASPAQRDALDEERTASMAFFQSLLTDPERTKAFVVQFSRDIDLLQDTTGSREQVRAAIGQLETDRESRVEAVDTTPSDPRAGRYPGRAPNAGSTGRAAAPRRANNALYDALFLSADEIAKKQSGRKVLVVLSDGDDSGSRESLSSAIEAAQRADTVIYAVYYKERKPSDRGGFSVGQGGYCDDTYPGNYPGSYPGGYPDECNPKLPETAGRPDGRKTLERICTETGGRMFEASKKEPLAGIYKQITEDLNAQYRLTFVPDKDASSGGYHHLLLTVGKSGSKDLVVQARDGYYMGD